MKFGGTSVANIDRIKAVALKIKSEVEKKNKIIAVVSAMSGVTNDLVSLVKQASETYESSEYDAVLSSGEQVTSALLSIALQSLGIKSRSWLGWQIPIITNDVHGNARIKEIKKENILKKNCFDLLQITFLFQGFNPDTREITTLGRGGSDTTAVALAGTNESKEM